MADLNKKEVFKLYSNLKKKSLRLFQKGDFEGALKNVSSAARLVYLFNCIYRDDDLEKLLFKISLNTLPPNMPDVQIMTKKYVLIDALGWSYMGLSQQYLRGLISMDVDFLYISEYVEESKSKIYNEVKSSNKGKLCLVPDGDYIEKIEFVYNAIIDFGPSVILCHISPWDVIATTVLYALPDVIKYNINLTDHAFWLGTGCFNYIFEFRECGCAASVKKRGFNSSQLLLNPFYPIVDDNKFLGMPEETKDKTILFSGGNYYKIYGDNLFFLQMMKKILDENPDTIILFAGTGDEKILVDFIAKNCLEKRLLLLGYRKDIDQVFAHCDIYLSTYPFAGGLMTQYAAYYGKPVVAYSKDYSLINNVDCILSLKSSEKIKITYNNLEDYYAEIAKLVGDKHYRAYKGNMLKNVLNTKGEFDISLKEYLNEKKYLNFNIPDIDYKKENDWYIDVNRAAVTDFVIVLFMRYKILAYFYFPKVLLKYTPILIKRAFNHLLKLAFNVKTNI